MSKELQASEQDEFTHRTKPVIPDASSEVWFGNMILSICIICYKVFFCTFNVELKANGVFDVKRTLVFKDQSATQCFRIQPSVVFEGSRICGTVGGVGIWPSVLFDSLLLVLLPRILNKVLSFVSSDMNEGGSASSLWSLEIFFTGDLLENSCKAKKCYDTFNSNTWRDFFS